MGSNTGGSTMVQKYRSGDDYTNIFSSRDFLHPIVLIPTLLEDTITPKRLLVYFGAKNISN
jgi:hypothetical protein